MWRNVLTDDDFDEYLGLIQSSHPVYVESTLKGLRNIVARPGSLFIFDSTQYKILLAVCSYENGTGRIINAIPTGDYKRSDLNHIAKQLIRKVRSVFDSENIKEFKADVLDDYKNKLLNQLYHKTIPNLMHEFSDGRKRMGGQHATRGMKFKRLQTRMKDDEKFIGPGV